MRETRQSAASHTWRRSGIEPEARYVPGPGIEPFGVQDDVPTN